MSNICNTKHEVLKSNKEFPDDLRPDWERASEGRGIGVEIWTQQENFAKAVYRFYLMWVSISSEKM